VLGGGGLIIASHLPWATLAVTNRTALHMLSFLHFDTQHLTVILRGDSTSDWQFLCRCPADPQWICIAGGIIALALNIVMLSTDRWRWLTSSLGVTIGIAGLGASIWLLYKSTHLLTYAIPNATARRLIQIFVMSSGRYGLYILGASFLAIALGSLFIVAAPTREQRSHV
jgi:hypothetical protein